MKSLLFIPISLAVLMTGCSSEQKPANSAEEKAAFVQRWEKCRDQAKTQLDEATFPDTDSAPEIDEKNTATGGWRVTVGFQDRLGKGFAICETDSKGTPTSTKIMHTE